MDKLVLSFNDIPLILVIFQSLLFSVLLATTRLGNRRANFLLAGFVLALGLDAFDTLIYWSPSIKDIYLKDSLYIFYCFKFSVYIAAPLLFLYVKATIHTDFRFQKSDAVHLIPLALFAAFVVALLSSLTHSELVRGIREYGLLFKSPVFQFHLWVRHLLYVGYGGASFYALHRYREELKDRFSNLENIDMFWLRMLIGGFLTLWAWVFTSYLLTYLNYSMWLGNVIGISGNIFSFIFVNALVFYSIAKSNNGKKPVREAEPPEAKPNDKQDLLVIEQLDKLMHEGELFLDQELTLEQLAERAATSPRKISGAINRQCKQNFFDYINGFRVARAAKILQQQQMKANMLDVLADAGFNSKSTFYRAFKRVMKMSPSEYCAKLASSPSAQAE